MELLDTLTDMIASLMDEWYLVTEFFEDVEDDRRPYLAGSIYPAKDAPVPSADRIRALTGNKNGRGHPVLVKLQEHVSQRVSEQVVATVTECIANTPVGEAAPEEGGEADEADAPADGPPDEEKPPDTPAKPAGKAASRKKAAELAAGGLAPAT